MQVRTGTYLHVVLRARTALVILCVAKSLYCEQRVPALTPLVAAFRTCALYEHSEGSKVFADTKKRLADSCRSLRSSIVPQVTNLWASYQNAIGGSRKMSAALSGNSFAAVALGVWTQNTANENDSCTCEHLGMVILVKQECMRINPRSKLFFQSSRSLRAR